MSDEVVENIAQPSAPGKRTNTEVPFLQQAALGTLVLLLFLTPRSFPRALRTVQGPRERISQETS